MIETIRNGVRIVDGMPFDVYRKQTHSNVPLFSKSIAGKILSNNAYNAWYFHPKLGGHSKKQTDSMRAGSILHALLLGASDEVVTVDYDAFRTNEAKAERDTIEESGRIAVSQNEASKFDDAKNAITRQISNLLPVYYDAPHMTELSVMYNFNGVECQSRYDWISPEYGLIIDLKKTNDASRENIERQIANYSYDVQDRMYTYAAEKAWPEIDWTFLFIFFENNAPHHVHIGPIAPPAQETGEAKALIASEQWRACLDKGAAVENWPDYGYSEDGFSVPFWEYKKYIPE